MANLDVERVALPGRDTVVFRLRGTLGESRQSFEFLEDLRRVVHDGKGAVLVDLGQVKFVSSTGVGILAAAHSSACRAGRHLALVAVPPAVRRVLQICGIQDLIPHHETQAEAEQALG